MPPNLYRRFESAVALLLTALISIIILVALWRLTESVVMGLVMGVLDPADKNVFQTIFAELLTLLIALEFNHTLQFFAASQRTIIQTRVVLLIAMLAVARKVIVIDIDTAGGFEMIGLAAVMLALGVVYWLVRERDERVRAQPSNPD